MSSSIQKWPNGPYTLDFDYARHVEAMRELLFRNQQADVALSDEISDSDERARRSTGEANYFAVEHTVDLKERSIYQDVAHSMAAVGMIAPFMEGVFKDIFERIQEELPRGDLAKNILKVVERRGLKSYLPCELAPTMEALFRYRNDLFHWGFEWPAYIRQQFQDATAQWPDGWFEVATENSEPWIFSMSMLFINHCVEVAEAVPEGLQAFLVDEDRKENGLPPLVRQKVCDSSTCKSSTNSSLPGQPDFQ